MRAALRTTVVLLFVLLSAVSVLLPAAQVAADPGIANNGDGSSTATWNFSVPSQYALSNVALGGGAAMLQTQVSWWNSTTQADFTAGTLANTELSRYPGAVDLQNTAQSPVTATLQPNATAGQDAYIDGTPGSRSTNFGAATTLLLDNSGNSIQRPLIRFDLSGLPPNAVLDGATLALYMNAGVGNGFVAEVHALTTAWNEATTTWNSPWTTAGGDFSGYVVAQASLTNTVGWDSWNVTQVVDLWYRGRIANDGFVITMPVQGTSSQKSFYSSDYGTAALRPQLVIHYRVFGNSGTYVSAVGGPGALANWANLSWNATTVSLPSDEFGGTSLNAKWTWTNPPASYDVGATTPGSLRVDSSTGTDLYGATATANLLTQPMVGNFTAQMKFSFSPSANYQKAGLVVYVNGRNWYSVGETFAAGTTDWAVTATADAASTSRYNASSGNPVPAYVEIARAGNTFRAYASPDGVAWTLVDTYAPTTEYPWEVRLGLFVSDGRSGAQQHLDVDYLRATSPVPSTVAVQTRTGNTSVPDASWSAWSGAWPNPLGSTLDGTSSYMQFQLTLSMGPAAQWPSPAMSPAVGDVNVSWAHYVASGTVTTNDLVASDVASWGTFTAAATLNGQTLSYAYSTDSGSTWTPVASGASLAAVSPASGTLRFRATLSTADPLVTPILRSLEVTYVHALDHFYVVAPSGAAAGAPFAVTVTAKDAANQTITAWTGTVDLAARLADGITPGTGTLGTTSVPVTSGGTATLTTQTYTKAETIRILASNGAASGLSGAVTVSPGALASVAVAPSTATLLLLDSQVFTAEGFDAWNNAIAGLTWTWSAVGGVGNLNRSTGASVTFTSSSLGNGTVTATSSGVSGTAALQVVSGTRPWLAFQTPSAGDWLTAVVTLRYTNSSDAVSVEFDYNDGAGWTAIGTSATLSGAYAWDTRGLNFTGGSLRAIVTNNRTITNTTTVSPVNVDNAPPTISLGPVLDDQSTSGTLTIAYTASSDVARVDLSYFDGAWHPIGTTTSITGSYVWTPSSPINGVTLRAVATDHVGLTSSAEEAGVGNRTLGTNGPSVQGIPVLHIQAGVAYTLNLTFYVSDPDTPLASLTIWTSDVANATVGTGTWRGLTVTYSAEGTYVLTLWASDGTNTAWSLITIVVSANSPPVLVTAFPTAVFDENAVLSNGLNATVGSFFNDPDGDPLNYTVFAGTPLSYQLNANGSVDFWAPYLWYGSRLFRIRATDPSGGFAEGGFTVVVRFVDQPPVLSIIPAQTVTANQSASLDLTSYVSDVDTPLANLTLSVDSPYVTVQGLTLLLDFPATWTGTGFNVTLSDGYQTATQYVAVTLVIPPPPPAWWQAPYVLAIPPVGLLVVVAMFAQRQRWRPAKAFLVDERGQLLREFTLDPSCEVTYEQAVQAGALDAVEKDVRVAKYHARAVHGDLLSLVMLAVGPANVAEIEFARGILVNIQDKFEDRVRQRAGDVRADEASLQAERARAEEERADLQVRSRVFGDMVNAFTIARGKLDEESRALRAQATDLAAQGRTLGEDRQSLDEQARQLGELRGSLDETASQLEHQKASLTATERSLGEREAGLAPKERDLTAREAALAAKESNVAEREQTLSAAESKFASDLEDYHAKAQDVQRLEAEVAEERKSLDELSVQLDGQRSGLDARAGDLQARERDIATAQEAVRSKLTELEPRESALARRESDVGSRETALEVKAKALSDEDARLTALAAGLRTQEAGLATRASELADERKAIDELTQASAEERKTLEAKASSLSDQESEVAKARKDLEDLKANLGPREAALLTQETDLRTRETALADERAAFQNQQDLVAAKALEIQQQMEAIREREEGLQQEKLLLQDAKGAFESQEEDLRSRVAAFEGEVQRREADLADQERTLGEARMRLTKDRQDFDTAVAEKNQWIAGKEIELEAKEQSLADREAEIRAHAAQNATRLSELAAREETLEIDSAKLDKARAELESHKAEVGALARDLEARRDRLREDEARKGEELRTWQTTLESEQALLKEQKETFEKDMQDLRESWAGRMIRVEQREEELKEREAKVQGDVEWVARNESELGKREKVASENLKAANELKAQLEHQQMDLEQRALEIESRERSLREEAADRSIELEKRTEALQVTETELAGRKAQWERELATQTQKLKDREAELAARKGGLDSREADLNDRETALAGGQDALRQDEDRLGRERLDLRMTQQRLEAGQLELTQAREKLDAETQRFHTEADAEHESIAAKEADLRSERERLERESANLQEKLGAKAKELAAREKAVAAREGELRSEEHDLEARVREIESRERQAEARVTEIAAREAASAQSEEDLKSRRTAFDLTVHQFETEAAARQKEWQDLQAMLKSQEQQLAASTETRQAEIRKRMDDLEQRERGLNAVQAQAQIERARLEAESKTHAAKQAEVDAAAARSEKRFAELKTMEDELLKARQGFESEKASWAARRSEEMKQLEATRDAAGEQTQQAERLIEESQRRAFVAAEAEKASKRQAEELTTAQGELEHRRKEAEKAEKDLEAQMAQLREASQGLATKEVELASRAKDLEALQARLAALEKKSAETTEQLSRRTATLDHESERISLLAADLDKRQAEDETRRAALENRLADLTKREQVLTTELQRADNLMEDLNRKAAEMANREKGFVSREKDLAAHESALTRRDAELVDGMQTLERMRKEHEQRNREADEHHRAAAQARKEAETAAADAGRMKAQAEAMQTEVSKNMRFLQKKALDVLDREERIRTRENRTEEDQRALDARAQILEKKERSIETEREELVAKLEKARQETEKVKAKLAETEKAGKSTVDTDEWKRDIENRVKIIQRKALDLLDREEKLRKREEELKALAAQLGVETAK